MSVLVDPTTGAVGKKISRSVLADGAALCSVKWNPQVFTDVAGAQVTTATVEQKALGLEFLANTVADSGIDSYTSASGAAGNIVYADAAANSIGELLDIINGVEAGQGQATADPPAHMIRWRADLGDFRPGFVLGATSGLAVGAANVLLGLDPEGLAINGDTSGLETADLYSVGVGSSRARPGGGSVFADHFASDYVTTIAGVRFEVRAPGRRREEQPGLASYSVHITEVRADMVYASGAKVVTIYDVDNNIVGGPFPIAANVTVPAISEDTPIVGPAGSPLFVECVGVGALTDGPLTVTADIRVA